MPPSRVTPPLPGHRLLLSAPCVHCAPLEGFARSTCHRLWPHNLSPRSLKSVPRAVSVGVVHGPPAPSALRAIPPPIGGQSHREMCSSLQNRPLNCEASKTRAGAKGQCQWRGVCLEGRWGGGWWVGGSRRPGKGEGNGRASMLHRLKIAAQTETFLNSPPPNPMIHTTE